MRSSFKQAHTHKHTRTGTQRKHMSAIDSPWDAGNNASYDTSERNAYNRTVKGSFHPNSCVNLGELTLSSDKHNQPTLSA